MIGRCRRPAIVIATATVLFILIEVFTESRHDG
jgi:hypothetical protein